MKKFLFIILLALLIGKIVLSQKENNVQGWSISVLPASVRLDPVTNKIIEERFSAAETGLAGKENLLEKNWIYDGNKTSLVSRAAPQSCASEGFLCRYNNFRNDLL